MKYLLTTSLLSNLLGNGDESKNILSGLENLIQEHHKFYATALSLFELLQAKPWKENSDQKEFLHQSGILCEEIYPVTQEDLKLYTNLIQGKDSKRGLEWIELSVAVNRGMDSLLVYKSELPDNKWMKIHDLKS